MAKLLGIIDQDIEKLLLKHDDLLKISFNNDSDLKTLLIKITED